LSKHEIDSATSFDTHFLVVGDKMEEYNILPDNTYNIEKGFLLGKITKAKRIFLKDLETSRKILRAGQDGSKELIMVVATIYGDGTTLPPLRSTKAPLARFKTLRCKNSIPINRLSSPGPAWSLYRSLLGALLDPLLVLSLTLHSGLHSMPLLRGSFPAA
jgi:hypothetical protein